MVRSTRSTNYNDDAKSAAQLHHEARCNELVIKVMDTDEPMNADDLHHLHLHNEGVSTVNTRRREVRRINEMYRVTSDIMWSYVEESNSWEDSLEAYRGMFRFALGVGPAVLFNNNNA